MSHEVVVARYGELWLKGRNRADFEQILVRNCRKALEPIASCKIARETALLIVTPEDRLGDVTRRLTEVFGLSSLSPARRTEADPEAIAEVAAGVLAEALEARPRGVVLPFRVASKRGDKRFALTSTELDRFVADRVLPPYEDRLRVDLSNPELTLGVHVRPEGAYVFAERLPGAGGLPVGTLGRATCLLSGGIDSPVAAWLAMKRGLRVSFTAFHSYPYIGESYLAKVRRLVGVLSRYQDRSLLYEVPFAAVQAAIQERCPAAYRTVLYRRTMQRIAARLGAQEKSGALVTGESLGQVASQTLENLTCIGAATSLPVLRPLISFDKSETVALAKRIGTFPISIEPEPDCCTVFLPKKPILRGRVAVCEDAERALDVDGLVDEALAGTERRVVDAL